MARDPGSIWKPLPEAGAPDGHTKTQFIVHSTGTMASAAANWNYFLRPDVVVESTFIVGWGPEDPTLQIMDSTDNADANGSANRRGISVEVVGDGVGGYNDWQIRELVRLGSWAKAAHGIPPRIIRTEPDPGFGWHVMFGAPGPWTSVRGKVCPGARRIQQLKDTVFPAIFSGANSMEDDMPLTNEDVQRVAEAVWGSTIKAREGIGPAQARDWLTHAAVYSTRGAAAVTQALTASLAGRKELTAEEIEAAVEKAILDAGEALRAASAAKPDA